MYANCPMENDIEVNHLERQEVKNIKILFIDDDAGILESLQRAFHNNIGVTFSECHDIKDALSAITQCQPDVIFLDHHLTDYGNEGIEIADLMKEKGIKFFSTTSAKRVLEEYQKRGIENTSKTDLKNLKSIMANLADLNKKQSD